MKAIVRLTYAVELVVEGETEDDIYDWMNCTTPSEAKKLVGDKCIEEEFEEELIGYVSDDAKVDYVID